MNAPASTWLLDPEQRRRFSAAYPPRPARYWFDLLSSAALAWGAFVGLFFVPLFSLPYLALAAISVLAFLRAGSFMHELNHRRADELPGLHFVWNLLIGVPALVPSLMMHPHHGHHRPATFATPLDPEYAPISRWPRWRIVNSLVAYGAIALFMPIRWGLVTPLSRLHPALRRHAIGQLSTADVARGYDRPDPVGTEARIFVLQELACFAVVWGVLAANLAGWIPWELHLHRLLAMGAVLILNQARLLAVHRYDNLDGVRLSPRAQSLDALTFGADPLSRLIAPIGFAHHVLHHELPAAPYHALPAIHDQLLAELPAEHPYRGTLVGGFGGAFARLWRGAARNPAWPLPPWGSEREA